MSALECVVSQDTGEGNLGLKTDQSAGGSVLPPSSWSLKIDEKLQLNNENFKQTIDDFFKDKHITPLSQLTATPPFPTPHVLAQFASKTYTDYKTGETDAQYETRLVLPDGWKLLTTASSNMSENGYFGAAYWHPEHQQVVIAHRGLVLKNWGALLTDVNGVLHNRYVPQMESAITFAHKVVEGLKAISREKGVSFQLFYTGHCLGGWLAQITTFTTVYLKIEGNVFIKSNDVQDCYRPHTVVFDSPGCKDMLSQMTDKLDVRLDGRSIDIEHLDITSYLSGPNLINSCKEHVGMVYCIFTDLRSVEWTDCINNYCPEFTEEVVQVQGNHPMIYQTGTYDKRVRSLSVFSQQEQQFLQDYRRLRQLPELFEPNEIFSSMRNNEAQEEAEKILQNFEIVDQKICCPDVNTLQDLIPYVKRLLQLFPQIKESTKRALSSHEATHKFYQLQTRRYLEQINQSPLQFEPDANSLSEILRRDQHQVILLNISDGDEWTGLMMVFQVLQKNNCLCEGQYMILTLKCLLTVSQLMGLNTLMPSTETPYLLLMACENNQLLNDEEEEMLRTLFNTIEQKKNIKLFLITQSRDSSITFLEKIGREIFGDGFVTKHKQLTLSDLTTSSQEKLLEKSVSFQGSKISLNKLVPTNSTLATLVPLGALLEGKELEICEPLPTSNKYSADYYIGITLRHQEAIRQDISHMYSTNDLDKLLEQAENHSLMLISDTAGMGKFTVLSHLSNQIKQKFPAKWVVRIDLNGHTDALKALKQEQIDKERAIEFVSKKLLKLERGLEMELFKQCCEQKQNAGIVIMMDRFDEINPSCKDTVIDLLQALSQTAVEQLWVATGQHLREELEDKLQQLSYIAEPFSGENQFDFLRKFGILNGWFTDTENGKEEEETVNSFSQPVEPVIILPTNLTFLGLHEGFVAINYELNLEDRTGNRMRNDAAKNKQQSILEFAKEDHQLLALKMLFDEEQVAQLKTEKHFTLSAECLIKIGIVKKDCEGNLQFIHCSFADYFVADFLVNQLTCGTNHSQNVQDFLLTNIFLDTLYRVIRHFIDGLLSKSKPSKETLKQYGNRIGEIRECCKQAFYQAAYEGNANIIGFCLESLEMGGHRDTINELLLAKDKEGQTAWHLAARWGNIKVLEKLWDWAVNKLTTKVLKDKLLLAENSSGNTAWNVAAKEGNTEVLQKIWDLAKKALTPEELKTRLFFAKDDRGQTALHAAAEVENLELLLKLWEFAKEELTAKDVANNFLLVKDLCGLNAWLHSKEVSHKQMLAKLKEICEWAKQELKPEDLNEKCMLATDIRGKTAWHIATETGNIQLLEKIWEWAKGPEMLLSKLMLAKDEYEKTAFHVAAERSYTELLQKLWDWAIEYPQTEELQNELLLSKCSSGLTAWHKAAELGNLEILRKIWEWAKAKLPLDLNNELLLATDVNQQNVLHLATKGGVTKVLEEILEQCKEKLRPEDLQNKLLLAQDRCEKTAWHIAADLNNIEILQKIWEWAEKILTTEEINNKLLLATDDMGRTAWHVAANNNNIDALKRIWEWAEENLTTEEINNKLLLATHDMGRTAWHMAAKNNNIDILKRIWEWAENKLELRELKSSFLLAKDSKKETAWHASAECGNTEVLQELREWAKSKLTRDELKDILFETKDNEGRTVKDLVESTGNSVLLFELHEWVKKGKKSKRKFFVCKR